jgi:hypothetical protein
MRIKSNGNVGIGTTNPAYPLDVNGVINAQSGLRTPNTNLGAFKIVTGTLTLATSLAAATATNTNLTFGYTFGSSPTVVITSSSGGTGEAISYMALGITTTSCTVWYRNNHATTVATNIIANWIAIGAFA